MDFFAAQDLARRNSGILVGGFLLALVVITLAVYLAVAVLLDLRTIAHDGRSQLWDSRLFLIVALGVGLLIGGGSVYRFMELASGGGSAVAAGLGGRLVDRSTTDAMERRLINVIEEMALASGIPAPPVYVLDAENTINAFAAGARPSEAVVAVTRGTLEQLSRDELQGVVAHEFSHILNGDMGLNLRLIGLLHGILLLTLTGRVLARARGRNAAPAVMLGVALIVIGYIGVLCGKLIKAAVSRQREFLADAAAVQFTRNPEGLAGALQRIAATGSMIHHPQAEEASHMLFDDSDRMTRLFATHPPIDDRLARLGVGYRLRHRRRQADVAGEGRASRGSLTPFSISANVGALVPEGIAQAATVIDGLDESLRAATHHPGDAANLALSLFLDPGDLAIRNRQQDLLVERLGVSAAETVAKYAASLDQAKHPLRLHALDLSLAALRLLSPRRREGLLQAVDAMIAADGRTSIREYALRRLLHRGLQGPVAQAPLESAQVAHHCGVLFALIARAGHPGDATQAAAAYEAARRLAPVDALPDLAEAATRRTEEIDLALTQLASATPIFRRKLVESCAAAALHDKKVTAGEYETLRAVCDTLESPLPLLPDSAFEAA
jgi:Zn-dependent protease with chaperone function